ncbi:phosphonate ABC transporter, permease protein PhnE [Paucilactobacillus sp. N302-9]
MNEIPQRTTAQRFHFKWIAWTLVFVICLVISAMATGVDMTSFWMNINQFFVLIEKMAHPNWEYTSLIISPVLETIQMALIGTTLGTLVAIPLALLAARNIVTNTALRSVVRFILNLVRTLPDLLLAALFVAIVGIGPIAGVFTLAIFSFGMISKLFYEAVETIDDGPLEALRASGANKIQVIVFAVIPQIFNQFLSYFLYTFEINVRASTVLGYLGAGGIGVFLQRSLDEFRYDNTSVIIIAILIIVLVIDGLSNYLREKLQ